MDFVFEAFLLSEIREERGTSNEFEFFKKFYKRYSKHIEKLTNHFISNSEEKNNVKSEELRKDGNDFYQKGKFEASIIVFTESLSYATSNGKEYGLALANRSAVLFHLEDYENCIKDLELCLKTDYPSILKPKMYIRLTKCYFHVGKLDKMQEILKTCIQFIKTLTDKKVIDSYNKNIQEMVTNMTVKEVVPKKDYDLIPALDENPSFANASKSVKFKYYTTLGPHVVATQDINCGDVIFVEKAFAISLKSKVANKGNIFVPFHCHLCANAVTSCIPCKGCVDVLYCSEKCLDDDWTNYHQWECKLYKTDFLDIHKKLVLRILIKAGESAFINNKIDFTNEPAPYNDKSGAYKCIINFPINVLKLKKTNPREFKSYLMDSMLIAHYLKSRTNFITHLKQFPSTRPIKNELVNKIGGLMLRFSLQIYANMFWLTRVEYKDLNFYDKCYGRAIFPFAAQLTHSCLPNTFEYFVGDTLVVKASKPIKSGDIVYRSYFKFDDDDRHVIREVILELCSIKCKCDLCTGKTVDKRDWDKLKCILCQGNANLLTHSFIDVIHCENCRRTYPVPEIVMENITTSVLLNEGVISVENIAGAKTYLTIFSTTFQPFHKIFDGLYTEIFKMCGRNGLDTEFLKIMKKVINYNKTRSGDFSFKKLINEAKIHLPKAREIIRFYSPHVLNGVDDLDQAILAICIKNVLILTEE